MLDVDDFNTFLKRVNNSYSIGKDNTLLLKSFFLESEEWLRDKDLLDWESLREFGNLFESFLDKNNLRENRFLTLFLTEIRCEELSFRVNDHSHEVEIKRSENYINKIKGTSIKNDKILIWYEEVNRERESSIHTLGYTSNEGISYRIKEANLSHQYADEDSQKVF